MSTTDKLIPKNFTRGRKGLDMPLFYVVHTYNGKGRSLYNWFATNKFGVSAHTARFKDGNGENYVSRNDTAHHAGNFWANVRSIGIEHQDDAVPSDNIRTDALYEQTAQDIATDALSRGHKILNASNIKPHSDFTKTGCPGALDINRIRARANEILQAAINNVIPEWKKNCLPLETERIYIIEKDVVLYDISDNSKVKSFNKGEEIKVAYILNNYYITKYSFENTFDHGFKVADLEYKENKRYYLEILDANLIPLEVMIFDIQVLAIEKDIKSLILFPNQVRLFDPEGKLIDQYVPNEIITPEIQAPKQFNLFIFLYELIQKIFHRR